MSGSKLPFRFELLVPRGAQSLDHVAFDELHAARKVRAPRLSRREYTGDVDDREVMCRPASYVGGQSTPVIELVTVEVHGDATFEEVRLLVSAALAEDMERPDIVVAVA